MKDSTSSINWRGYADGSAVREAVINTINRELAAATPEGPGPADLEFLGLFRHSSGYSGSLVPNHGIQNAEPGPV